MYERTNGSNWLVLVHFACDHRGKTAEREKAYIVGTNLGKAGRRIIATLCAGGAVIWRLDKPDHPELVMVALARFGKSDDIVITISQEGGARLWNASAAGLRAKLNLSPAICMTAAEARAFLGEASLCPALKAGSKPPLSK